MTSLNQKCFFWTMLLALSPLTTLYSNNTNQATFDESVNLVMRKVGDQLLNIKGDTTSKIPPVVQKDNLFSIQLNTSFKYGDLPSILDQALRAAKIESNYHVLVRSCDADRTAILGYIKSDLSEQNLPCRSREQEENCNIIELRILETPIETMANTLGTNHTTSSNTWLFFPLFSALTLALSGYFLFRKKQPHKFPEVQSEQSLDNGIPLGSFIFDVQNQTLKMGTEEQNLTFREAKILKIFADQPNQVVTRNTLIDEVWGKEGVIVGRSLDVFISRLRKLLKKDGAVSITNIHGVGYKLEVAKS